MIIRALLVLLLGAATAHATITATDRGTGTNNTSSTSVAMSPGSNMTAGNTGIVVLAMDNAAGASSNLTATSYTDSVGNIWYVRFDTFGGAANATHELVLLQSRLTANFTTANTLTVTLSSASLVEAWTMSELSATGAILYLQNAGTSSQGTGAPTITTGDMQPGDLILGMGAAESADTFVADADTSNGSWSSKQSIGVGSGITGMSVISQTKVVSAYGGQTWNPTLTSVDVRLGWATFTETDVKARTQFSNIAGETSVTVPFNLPLDSGSIGVLLVVADNAGTNGSVLNFSTPLTDTKSNTWTLRQNNVFDPGTNNQGVEIAIYTSVLTAALTTSDSVICTFTVSTLGKSFSVYEFKPTGAGAMSYVTGAIGAGANTATPTITTTSIASGNYVVGVAGEEWELPWTGATDATNGTWSMQLRGGRGTTGGGLMGTSQWKKVTAAGAQTYNPTISGAQDTLLGWIEINDSSSVTAEPSANFLQLFP